MRKVVVATGMMLAVVVVLATPGVARAGALEDARAFIGKQVDQIKAEDVAGLRDGFTDRLKDRITADAVKKAKKEIASYTIEELVHDVAPAGEGLKIKMKNGRSLTTLLKVDGKWKADTIWFK